MAKVVKRRNRWVFDHYIGEKRQRPSFNTRQEAENFKKDFLLRKSGLSAEYGSVKLESLKVAIHKYLEVVSNDKSVDTQGCEKNYFLKLYDYMLDEKKLFYVSDVESLHLEEFRANLRSKVSASTVNRYFNTYKNFFNKCVEWNFTKKSPALTISKLEESPVPRKLWDKEQMENVIKAVPPWAGDVLFFIATSTARPGREIRDLTWGDVDFENSTFQLKSYKGKGKLRIRVLPMPKNLFDFLYSKKEAARRMFRARDVDRVFSNSLGNPVESDVLNKVIRAACERLGYEGLCPYGLRHTSFTDMVKNNESMEKIRKLAGHSALTTTQKYLKINVDHLRESMETTTSRGLERPVAIGHLGRRPFVTGK